MASTLFESTSLEILRIGGPTVKNSYIVKLKSDVDRDSHLEHIMRHFDPHSRIIYRDWSSDVFHGYSGIFHEGTLEHIRSSSDVEYIEEDPLGKVNSAVTQTNAPWGLQRISQNAKLTNQQVPGPNFTYKYDSTAGTGVDIYVVDTGIYLAHNDFGGRATWGVTFAGTDKQDLNGHGTHCAGTAGGTQFGVAKKVSLIAVKVTSDSGSVAGSDYISGVNWVKTHVTQTKRPSVASISLEFPQSSAINSATASLPNAGIHTSVAAGNDNADASGYSPASEPTVNTVGATTIADARASFSNYGSVLDLFAPGNNVISCGISSPTATATMSGTSMACPHVSGLIAYLIGRNGNSSAADMTTKLKTMSVKNALSSIPSGTANNLARNDA